MNYLKKLKSLFLLRGLSLKDTWLAATARADAVSVADMRKHRRIQAQLTRTANVLLVASQLSLAASPPAFA